MQKKVLSVFVDESGKFQYPDSVSDNYIDERTLMLLGNRGAKVSCTVYTLRSNSPGAASS